MTHCTSSETMWAHTKLCMTFEELQDQLDQLEATCCVLDGSGTICFVNKAWRDFASSNGGDPSAYIGQNYLEVCNKVTSESESEQRAAQAVSEGIKRLLTGTFMQEFQFIYPCSSPSFTRECMLRAFPYQVKERPDTVVVLHDFIQIGDSE
mmetsp:Transcript_39780/g.100273  ORF Transcript_39780/g.100273 Transcript_39780/m.100273 type:complete len:151 (+) Transcript_39780:378-830(+)|eukprot:CAMPEP_0177654876 /NCGR_PEP_ID=MMETSP0447-20121125/14600_1 /TAXON_ID=0 /ORGANISM="Stygamoeba regulata, Strain BSH-02190019" /LENGTH=150 /DNA_ID=CAMNT_0019158623 /DNA_START=336 /DNA_END=788 /DNA_ORIENTATION=+